jgi:hypothetical protein
MASDRTLVSSLQNELHPDLIAKYFQRDPFEPQPFDSDWPLNDPSNRDGGVTRGEILGSRFGNQRRFINPSLNGPIG